MVSTATAKVPLGATTTVRKWYLDVDSGGGVTKTYTVVAATDLFTSTAHGLTAGNPVTFNVGAPAGITPGTTYYVLPTGLTTDAFKVSATVGGTALDVTADGGGSLVTGPVWTGVFGITDFKPTQDDTLQDDSDFDSAGFGSQTKTAEKWALEFKVKRAVRAATATAYDPGQEVLRVKAQGKMGPANSVRVRFYEMEPAGPRVEAYQGQAAVSWAPEGGSMEALDMVSVKLTGQGARTAITHPDAP